MLAVAIGDFGAPAALVDVPTPAPGPGEVLVRVRASSLNGFDVFVLQGRARDMMEHRFPVVLGRDFAGTVEATGEGATRFAVGDPVFGVVVKPTLGEGAFAQYLTVGEQYGVTRIPAGLDLPSAGAIALAGTAALNSVDAVAPEAGEIVLVSGATGGVGAIAVQYVAARGALVIATARPGPETDFVRGLGAVHVVDFTGDLAAQVRAVAPAGAAAILHFAGDPAQLADLLAPGGRIASTLGFGPEQLGDRDATATAVVAHADVATLDRLAADAAGGRLRAPVTDTYALEEVPKALAEFRAGTLGKLAVLVP